RSDVCSSDLLKTLGAKASKQQNEKLLKRAENTDDYSTHPMKRFLIKFSIVLILALAGYFAFIYFASYSEGIRAGELVKFSSKGVLIKTWEGEISQGVSEAQLFEFSVEDKEKEIIQDLKDIQGKYVKLHYFERYSKIFWLGDTKYFITKVEEDKERSNRRY